ncbi:MAG: hypothetical protein K0U37_04795 [Gammaproteobacteria bacterium]|nr:hypothetical protein [Gammaproteobacteria bacterium]
MHVKLEDLGEKEDEELLAAIRSSTATAAVIDLSQNDLYTRAGVLLGRGFSLVGPLVREINLANNAFYQLSEAQLNEALSGIPSRVTNVNLSYNGLHRKGLSGLSTVLQAMPNVLSVNLTGNRLERIGSIEEVGLVLLASNKRIVLDASDDFSTQLLAYCAEQRVAEHPNVIEGKNMDDETGDTSESGLSLR